MYCALNKVFLLNRFTADPCDSSLVADIWHVKLRVVIVIVVTLHIFPYWFNTSFLIFDIRVLWRTVLSARAPEYQRLKMVVRPVWR